MKPHQATSTQCAHLRVTWPSHQELAADDVSDHFAKYGDILELDWLEDTGDSSVETIRLKFASGIGVAQAMKQQRHVVTRENDGREITVKTFVKFSDNVRK